jgi:succinate dehydrogenase/fumarate reductase flavoprotein subunit
VLATGGFQADPELVRELVTPEEVFLRAASGATGDGLRLGLAAGAELSDGLDEFWGRAMPAPPARIGPEGFRPLGQSYARFAKVTNTDGEVHEPRTWSEIDVAQWIARQPGGRAWFAVPDTALGERVRERTVTEIVEAARAAGARVERRDGETVVEVVAGITTTLGGLRVDTSARAAEDVWACGADVGGISTGGWTSTLASALVLGLVAAESAVAAA